MRNRGFPNEFLQELKQKVDIVSVVSRYMRLDRKGSKYWGCCPFHNEKTPSFCVMEEQGQFYCFGCKEYGDVVDFVQKMESCEFIDAVKLLAEQAHLEIPEVAEDDKETHKKAKLKARTLQLLDETWKHYHENLYKPNAQEAQQYIKKRNFTRHELEDFKIGYSDGWTEIIDYLKSKGFTLKEMMEAGVINVKNGRYFDVVGGRLIFPIFNHFNECVGFSGRVLGQADHAKYKNTAETMVFQKGKVVFGINLIKKRKQAGQLNNIIVVEGQVDVIAMHRAGFKQTVAVMGSALTSDNANNLMRLSRNIILCFDGDTAGRKATLHSLEVLDKNEFNIRIIDLPEGMDPDEVLKNKGKDYFDKLIENAMSVMDYLIKLEKAQYDLTKPEQKSKFVKVMLEHFAKLNTPSEAEPYLEIVRDLTSVPMDILRRDLARLQSGAKSEKVREKTEESGLISRENGNIRAVKFVLASLVHGKSYVDPHIDYHRLLPQYENIILEAEKRTKISSYYDLFDVESMPILRDVLLFNFEDYDKTADKYFSECLWTLADGLLKAEQTALAEEFKKEEDISKRQKIMLKLSTIAKQLREKSLEEFYVRK